MNKPDSGYSVHNGLRVYESALAVPYHRYARHTLRQILHLHQISPGGTSLDLACGGGRLVGWLTGQGWAAHGCDLSSEMVDTARKNHEDIVERFFVADMCNLPSHLSFDLITVVFNSIHYVPEHQRDKVWECIGRVLKPGGCFVSQQNTLSAITDYWLNQTHAWESADGYAYLSGTRGPSATSVTVVKRYFELQEGGDYRLAQARNDYHFFDLEEMKKGLDAVGISVEAIYEGKTLTPCGVETQASSVWVVARKRTS